MVTVIEKIAVQIVLYVFILYDVNGRKPLKDIIVVVNPSDSDVRKEYY